MLPATSIKERMEMKDVTMEMYATRDLCLGARIQPKQNNLTLDLGEEVVSSLEICCIVLQRILNFFA